MKCRRKNWRSAFSTCGSKGERIGRALRVCRLAAPGSVKPFKGGSNSLPQQKRRPPSGEGRRFLFVGRGERIGRAARLSPGYARLGGTFSGRFQFPPTTKTAAPFGVRAADFCLLVGARGLDARCASVAWLRQARWNLFREVPVPSHNKKRRPPSGEGRRFLFVGRGERI